MAVNMNAISVALGDWAAGGDGKVRGFDKSGDYLTGPAYDGLTPDYYVSSAGSNANDGLTENNAFATLDYAWAQTSAGDIVGVADDLTQTLDLTVVEANPGTSPSHTVTVGKAKYTKINGGLSNSGAGTAAYHEFKDLHIDALSATDTTAMQFNPQWMKFISCVFEASGSAMVGNAKTHTAGNNQLYESCGFIGNAGRYVSHCAQVTNTLYRWCLVRAEANVWATADNPVGGLQVYSATDCAVIQTVVVDSLDQSSHGEYAGALSNTTNVTASLGCEFIEPIISDCPHNQISPGGTEATDLIITDPICLRGGRGVHVEGKGSFNGQDVDVNGGHVAHMSGYGMGASSGARMTVTDTNFYNNVDGDWYQYAEITDGGGITHTNLDVAAELAARVKIGVAGTYRGETGWKTPQAGLLFPFPEQDYLRLVFRAVSNRGFCADGQNLTDYIGRVA